MRHLPLKTMMTSKIIKNDDLKPITYIVTWIRLSLNPVRHKPFTSLNSDAESYQSQTTQPQFLQMISWILKLCDILQNVGCSSGS